MSLLITTDFFSLGLLSLAPLSHYLNVLILPTENMKLYLQQYVIPRKVSYCHFPASAEAITAELGLPAYVRRWHWLLPDTLTPLPRTAITVVRQIVRPLPHAQILGTAELNAEPFLYAAVSDQYITTFALLPDLLTLLADSTLHYCLDTFSLAQLPQRSVVYAQPIPTLTALGLLSSHTPTFSIRHANTAAYLSLLLTLDVPTADHLIPVKFAPNETTKYALVFRIQSNVRFGEIFTVDQLNNTETQWWLLVISTS